MSTIERIAVDGFVIEASKTSFETRVKPSDPPIKQVSAVTVPTVASVVAAAPPEPSAAALAEDSDISSDDDLFGTAMHEYDAELCDVCGGGESCEDDAVVGCDGCGIWVHQGCYGIDDVPADNWLVFYYIH